MLPNFLIVGAPKSGTTSVTKYCSEHPQIFMALMNEPNYFSNNYRGLNQPDYEKLFNKVDKEIILGECSPSYLWYDGAAENINKLIPKCKILIILRNPVDRLISDFNHGKIFGKYTGTLHSHLLEYEKNFSKPNDPDIPITKLVSKGFYCEHVLKYKNLIDKERLLIGYFDDLLLSPELFLYELFKFLGVDDTFLPNISKKYNVGGDVKIKSIPLLFQYLKNGMKYRSFLSRNEFLQNISKRILRFNTSASKRKISESTILKLRIIYKEDIKDLQQLLDKDLSHWIT